MLTQSIYSLAYLQKIRALLGAGIESEGMDILPSE